MSRPFVVLFSILALVVLPHSAIAGGFEHIARLTSQGYTVGAQAQLLDNGEVLGEIAAERQLSPASVSKLYASAAALERWGPQHRFTTRLVTTGNIDAQGILQGDLVLEGGGDPALATEDLWHLVQGLRQQGVTAVSGTLVISQWRYGPVECITTDRCESQVRSAHAYDARLSSAAVNYGNWCVSVMPGARAGLAARIVSCDTLEPALVVDNQVTTVAAGGKVRLNAERVTHEGVDTLRVSGQVPVGSVPYPVYRSSSDPARQTGHTLLALLEQGGLMVSGGFSTSDTPPPATARPLASVEGKPLQELLLRTLNYSNNFMADVLSLNLVDESRVSLAEAGQALEAFAEGLPGHGPATLLSGSGLTTENRTSAQGVNALLKAMYQRPALFPTFVAGLQLPANGPMRFIRRGGETFQSHVMLKTGTLNQPFAVRSVGGYFRTRSGRWGSFSVLVNGNAKTPYLSWSEVLDPLAEDLTAMIDAH
ncbi:D-alanyl-D-alanine carboxypeptidase/D-alanyl-D-alanine endopeptidase [Modicisalibacter xianhensis]|uniref:D-alanyl-D-alanine carboxypeptidase / D-alanyl-D-alanine-endopeptidase (Penicillin-binding protein 4) n=1 Tax=Modicisalibacter xianhensis TaxID=442341 RepID=A0A1I3ATS9_9GAMM|nr:D-alanyl-D-alanine carboxypeptidase/D-alanyl-D-alanine-endopeptidase [Halomonas xianhensis]SFH53432.1 D-alanyl-D-alanine carboxypeptidase / D-alanyl-D-alanine-endopeptidase (penicillin-binding protein 4) [Halomonas xianhensis]